MTESRASEGNVRDQRIGEVLNDYLDRQNGGCDEPQAELLAKHPDLADELRAHLQVVRDLGPSRSRISDLVARGILKSSSDPAYPAELGPYKIMAWLGQGGMGTVLQAYEESLERSVALKILRPDLADDEGALTRFTREAKAAAGLHHPNIITIHTVGQEAGVNLLAMEYVAGPTLGRLINEHAPLPAALIRDLFRQILAGLSGAHEAGLIHRDVKPTNILLDHGLQSAEQSADVLNEAPTAPGNEAAEGFQLSKGVVAKLADFGLARMSTSQTRVTMAGAVLGTPEYMSPEQARGDHELDHRTDLYSAGVVLYEMLTGQTPFGGATPSAVIHQILYEDPPDPRSLTRAADPALASLALRLMAKDPHDRFETAAQATAALESGTRVRLPAGRRWRRLAIAAAVLGTLLLVGITWLLTRPPQDPPLTDIHIEQIDGVATTRLLATYGDDPTPRVFHEFPPEVEVVAGATLVHVDDESAPFVVAGITKPLDGDCLFAFDVQKREIHRWNLSSKIQWPDCAAPPPWACYDVRAVDVDGRPGEEIVVLASDHSEYPTRISVIDPISWEIRSTFWHMGRLEPLRIQANFFGKGHPALIARGSANKLCGFHEPQERDEIPVAKWDIVSAVMILDPRDMDGLGPPRTHRVPDLPPARPHAYAFLNLPNGASARLISADGVRGRFPYEQEQVYLDGIEPAFYDADPDSGPWLALSISRPGGRAAVTLTVDRNLEIRHVTFNTQETTDEAYWRLHWHPIIQDGEYVDR